MQITPLFEQNMRILREQQPRLAKLLEEAKAGYEALPEVSPIEGKNGRWIEGLAPSPFFDHAVDPTPKKRDAKKSLFIMMGAGFPPYLFRRFRALPKGTLGVIVFEPNINVLIHTLCSTSVYIAVPTGCRLAFSCSTEREDMQEVLNVNVRPMGSYVVADAEFVIHEGEYEAFPDELKKLRDAFAKEVRIHIDILGNSPEDTLLGFRQVVLNMLWLLASPNLQEIGKAFKDKPFVCVASGPSLEKNIHLLKGMEDRCVIISADTALRRILEEGVRPHVVVTLERPTKTYTNYFKVWVEQYGEQCKDILLVGQGVSPPQVFGRWPGPKIAVGKVEIPVDRWFVSGVLGGNLLRSGMSVAHMALTLASVWEAERIALIGQDLSFSEEGASHAGQTVVQANLDIERAMGEADALEIPGALGGVVRTTNIWFLFLKVFESMIPEAGRPVYDCTEGGALIKGTVVQPLSEYLEAIPSDMLLRSTPADETRRAGNRYTDETAINTVLRSIDVSLQQLEVCSSILDEMEKKVQSAAAPGLSADRRRKFAYELSEGLDRLNQMNPVLAFIGQSYANLSGAVIARNRWLETVEEIRMWEKVHLEILQAHYVNIRYLRQWSMYAKTLCQIMLDGKTWLGETLDELYSEVPPEKASALFEDALERMDSLTKIERWGNEIASLNLLVARSDAYLDSWTPELRWQLALFLLEQGRAEEASHLMRSVAESFEEKEMPLDVIVDFFKDFARVVTTHDLCFIPQHRLAKLFLDNARRYAPDDKELSEMTESVLRGRNDYLNDLFASGMLGAPAGFESRRILAEQALNRKELSEALHIVWTMVLDFTLTNPNELRPLANWLISTLLKCVHAEEPLLRNTVNEILQEMVDRATEWGKLRLFLPPEFVALLQTKGLQFSLETADTVVSEKEKVGCESVNPENE